MQRQHKSEQANTAPKAKRRRIPELLAPVGGLPQLRAAVNNGADAVYLGGARFNARAKADNFGGQKLAEAVAYAHERNVKVYVTFNTLLKDRELPEALLYGAEIFEAGADAVIVQDMGLAKVLRENLPGLPLHLSTQGTVYNPQAVGLMKEFGFSRIVPARELTLEEIRDFAAACHEAEIEVEVFAHGALCMCYSGQCQMSRLLGGSDGKNGVRSGNRGLCAQPCRLPYTDDRGRTSYFLSPKDLCHLENIPALCQAGVDSLKIEGRLKSPEYVAITTFIYRKYLDLFAAEGKTRVDSRDMQELKQIFHRGGFTSGYLYGNPGTKILSGDSPKHTGLYVGRVRGEVSEKAGGQAARGAARKGTALVDIELTGELSEGDGVEIRGRAYETPAGGLVTFCRALPDGAVRIGDIRGKVLPGDRVYKVTDHELLTKAGLSFAGTDPAELDRQMIRRIPLHMEFTARLGEKAQLVIREIGGDFVEEAGAVRALESGNDVAEAGTEAGKLAIRVWSERPVEKAMNRPADPERIRTQLGKLGGTPFSASAEEISVEVSSDCAIAIGEINRMRREGIGLLLQRKRDLGARRTDHAALEAAAEKLKGLSLNVPAAEEVTSRIGKPVPLEKFMNGAEGIPAVFPVSKGLLDEYIGAHFDEIVEKARDTGILVGNPGWIRRFQEAGVKVYGGFGLNVYNEAARLAFEEMGIEVIERSCEAGTPLGGRIPLMITEHPVQSKTLTDRKGQVHEISRSPSGDKTIVW